VTSSTARSRCVNGHVRTVARCRVLPDGTYDVLIVDAETGDDGSVGVELAITSGEHKGEVVRLRGRFPGRDELDLLAAPATLVVSDGQPRVTLDP
jgi:hypothetical protein